MAEVRLIPEGDLPPRALGAGDAVGDNFDLGRLLLREQGAEQCADDGIHAAGQNDHGDAGTLAVAVEGREAGVQLNVGLENFDALRDGFMERDGRKHIGECIAEAPAVGEDLEVQLTAPGDAVADVVGEVVVALGCLAWGGGRAGGECGGGTVGEGDGA